MGYAHTMTARLLSLVRCQKVKFLQKLLKFVYLLCYYHIHYSYTLFFQGFANLTVKDVTAQSQLVIQSSILENYLHVYTVNFVPGCVFPETHPGTFTVVAYFSMSRSVFLRESVTLPIKRTSRRKI